MGGCLGQCLGSCLAADCVFLATLGSTNSRKAVRCTLAWLQVFTALLCMLVTRDPVTFTSYTCFPFMSGSNAEGYMVTGYVPPSDGSGVGVCACGANATCLYQQLAFRVQASAFFVYAMLLLMALSGCGRAAAHRYPVMKFMAVAVLAFVSLVIPNSAILVFSNVASVVSGGFLVVQALLMVDLVWNWNDNWARQMNDSLRAPGGGKGWQIALISASASFFVCALAGAWALHQAFGDAEAAWLISLNVFVVVALLVVSITEWCQQGNVLTSCAMCSYSVYLCWLALQVRPSSYNSGAANESGRKYSEALALVIVTLCLGFFATSTGPQDEISEPFLPHTEDQGSVIIVVRPFTAEQKSDFMKQCTIHALASLFVASILAPQVTWLNFYVRVAAVAMSLLVYGWTLVAPQLLKDRQF